MSIKKLYWMVLKFVVFGIWAISMIPVCLILGLVAGILGFSKSLETELKLLLTDIWTDIIEDS